MKRLRKYIVWLIILIAFVVALLLGIPQDLYKRISLEITYKNITKLNSQDLASFYNNYLLPSDKTTISLDDYVRQNKRTRDPISEDYKINSINIKDDVGIINRTYVACYSESCEGENRVETTLNKRYFFVNGRWYAPKENTVYCLREREYPMPEEFKRAISLIIQRFSESNLDSEVKMAKDFKEIRNCLDIQYAQSNADLEGAEGVFAFNKNSSSERLQIFVSSTYSIKDDLLTATLLTHEITHATIHAFHLDEVATCYENEAVAFENEYLFLQILNQEEKNSLNARYFNRSSESVFSLYYQLLDMLNYRGENRSEKILNYLKDNPFYQRECSLTSSRSAPPDTPLLTNTPIPFQTPAFDVKGCIARAGEIGQSCLNNCTSKADTEGDRCSQTNLVLNQNCHDRLLIIQNACLNDCNSTAKIDMNNCTFGRWPQ